MRRPSEFLASISRYPSLAVFGFCLFCATGSATFGEQVPHGTLDLVAENTSIVPGQEFTLGFHFKLEKGWHIYWVNPGDSGQPPRITWQLPQGISAGEIEWPVPHKLGSKSVADFGYEGEVLLLVIMRAARNLSSAQPAKVVAGVRFLICREVCIPGKAQVSLTLPVKAQPAVPNSALQSVFAATRTRTPRTAPANWKFSVNETQHSFVLSIQTGNADAAAIHSPDVFFFPLAESQIENATPQNFAQSARGGTLTLRKSDQLLKPIQRLKGVLVISGNTAYVVDAPIERAGSNRGK
jgi:DsbC/DsbD-like thiol-disulfide interchange protein